MSSTVKLFLLSVLCANAMAQMPPFSSLFDANAFNQQIQQTIQQSFQQGFQQQQHALQAMNQKLQANLQQMSQQLQANAMKQAIAQGRGGLTLAQINNGDSVLISNGHMYKCDGTMTVPSEANDYNVACAGDLVPLAEPQPCLALKTATVRSQIDDTVCLGRGNGNMSMTNINGAITCIGGDSYKMSNLLRQCPGMNEPDYITFTYKPDFSQNYVTITPNAYFSCANAANASRTCQYFTSGV